MGRAPPGSMGVGVGRKGFPGPALREWPRRQQLGVNGGGGDRGMSNPIFKMTYLCIAEKLLSFF